MLFSSGRNWQAVRQIFSCPAGRGKSRICFHLRPNTYPGWGGFLFSDFCLLTSVFCLLSFSLCAQAGEVDNAAALIVNTQSISIHQIEALFADSQALIRDKLQKGELSRANLEPAIRMAWSEALDTAAQDALMDQRADKFRRDIIRDVLKQAGEADFSSDRALALYKRMEGDDIRRLRRELITAAGGEDELRLALKRRGETMQEWENGLERELFRRYLLGRDLGPVIVSPSAIKAFYEKHPELFQEPETWRLRRIRVAKSKFSSAEVALQAAKMVKAKLDQDADFQELAAKVSDDPDFAKNGGLLSKDGKSDLPSGNFPEEEHIAAALQDGEISEPREVGAWWVIVQRALHSPVRTLSFAKAGAQAEALAFAEKLKQKKRELFEKLKRESYVEILKKDPPESLLRDALK
jgi:parvulin-like peptidyl-prolyl isomerase